MNLQKNWKNLIKTICNVVVTKGRNSMSEKNV
jgi:hypothetical protein